MIILTLAHIALFKLKRKFQTENDFYLDGDELIMPVYPTRHHRSISDIFHFCCSLLAILIFLKKIKWEVAEKYSFRNHEKYACESFTHDRSPSRYVTSLEVLSDFYPLPLVGHQTPPQTLYLLMYIYSRSCLFPAPRSRSSDLDNLVISTLHNVSSKLCLASSDILRCWDPDWELVFM